jgi:hypothetical protein
MSEPLKLSQLLVSGCLHFGQCIADWLIALALRIAPKPASRRFLTNEVVLNEVRSAYRDSHEEGWRAAVDFLKEHSGSRMSLANMAERMDLLMPSTKLPRPSPYLPGEIPE